MAPLFQYFITCHKAAAVFYLYPMKNFLAVEALPQALSKSKKQAFLFALARLFVFLLLIGTAIVGATDNPMVLALLLPESALFVWLIQRFNQEKDLQAYLIERLSMQEEKAMRAKRNLNSFDQGLEFQDKNHPFSSDLDLFGPHSLFQLTNHTVSPSGKALLANRMLEPLSPGKAKQRFASVQELRKFPELLEDFEASGRAFLKNEKQKRDFYLWLEKPEAWSPIHFLPLFLGPVTGMLLTWAAIFGIWPAGYLGIWIILSVLVLTTVNRPLTLAAKLMPEQGDVKTFRIWAERLSRESFSEANLQQLHAPFQNGQKGTLRGLSTLEQLSFLIQNRFNLMYLVFNMLFWLDFYLLWKAKSWKADHANLLAGLESNFDEWQYLISLAAFSNEENLGGSIQWTRNSELSAKNIKHPLLPRDKAIGNNFIISQSQKTILLTGSNMSGKTTFMRTLGINMVLANLGLQPFAEDMHIGDFQLYTSMRNADNLGESVSSFYAELSRIRRILQAAEAGEQVFFLMDEILKGTNTADRIQGSEALIRQLASTQSKGIISTHDIELSQLSTTLDYLVNKSFHSEIQDRNIHFDYKLKEGPCPSFNAHKLMELMGIKF